jgi:hypothetical protein
MAFRISYDDSAPVPVWRARREQSARTEVFETEREALRRARELMEVGDCHAVAVSDDSGEVVGGIRLQLKLGFTAE